LTDPGKRHFQPQRRGTEEKISVPYGRPRFGLAINYQLATINHQYFKELPAFYTSGGKVLFPGNKKVRFFDFLTTNERCP
jgi:hypothetical protein